MLYISPLRLVQWKVCVLYTEVLYSECPLSEVPLQIITWCLTQPVHLVQAILSPVCVRLLSGGSLALPRAMLEVRESSSR